MHSTIPRLYFPNIVSTWSIRNYWTTDDRSYVCMIYNLWLNAGSRCHVMLVMARVGNLAFLRPNNSILAFLFLVWPWKKCLAFWLYFGFFIKWQEFSLFFSIIYYEGMLNHKATCKNCVSLTENNLILLTFNKISGNSANRKAENQWQRCSYVFAGGPSWKMPKFFLNLNFVSINILHFSNPRDNLTSVSRKYW
jgi:hypothetical protein